MITLAIETSTDWGSIAFRDESGVLFSESFTADRGHGSELFLALQRALKVVPRYDQIVVGLGPGSYSGVRIGIAAAIGLELAREVPVVGIPSLLALETDVTHYLFIGDARRSTYYFAEIQDGECAAGPLLLDEAPLQEKLAAYPGIPLFSTAPIAAFHGIATALPSAERLALLAAQGRGISARGDLEPIYLRDPHITQPKPTR